MRRSGGSTTQGPVQGYVHYAARGGYRSASILPARACYELLLSLKRYTRHEKCEIARIGPKKCIRRPRSSCASLSNGHGGVSGAPLVALVHSISPIRRFYRKKVHNRL